MTEPQTNQEPIEISRLSPAALRALQARLPKVGCPSNDLEAGYLLGIQKVLDTLRAGFVIGDVA